MRAACTLIAILLGTGYPRPDGIHAGAATAIVAGDRWFVVDAGRGATMRIASAKLDYANLQAVFLTHFHSDHTAGLPDLFDTSWQFGRKARPLELYGPPGVSRLSKAMLEFFRDDIHYRRDLQEKHPAAGATINSHAVHEGVVWTYRTPLPESQKVAGLLAFYDEKLDVDLDGVRQPR